MLSRCVQQHRALLTELEKELAFEKCLNANFQELLADVQAARSALKESANVPINTYRNRALACARPHHRAGVYGSCIVHTASRRTRGMFNEVSGRCGSSLGFILTYLRSSS